MCGHYSPLKTDSRKLKNGDLLKIDLGCHIDGYIGQIAHTIVVGASKDNKVKGRKAEVIIAARQVFEAMLETIKKGKWNKNVTEIIKKAVEVYKCNPVEGVLSHRVKRHLIDCDEVIIGKETFDQTVTDIQFAQNEVYVIDAIISTGEGKPKETEDRTTIYKRSLENTYILKIKTARQFFSVVNKKYPTFPFSINGFEDITSAKLGVKECLAHDLLTPYPVLKEKDGEFVAQFKATLLLNNSHTLILNEMPFEAENYELPTVTLDKEVLAVLDAHHKQVAIVGKPLSEEEKKKRKDKKKKAKKSKEKKPKAKDDKLKDDKPKEEKPKEKDAPKEAKKEEDKKSE